MTARDRELRCSGGTRDKDVAVHRVDGEAGVDGTPQPGRAPFGARSPPMHTLTRALWTTFFCGALLVAAPVPAQQRADTATVSIYRVAPGKHLDFLKWMAAREVVDSELGVPVTRWYSHVSGDSWDYIAIGPSLDDATSDKVDAAARKRGLAVGPKAGMEFRQMMGWHSDTLVAGPMSATQLVDSATRP